MTQEMSMCARCAQRGPTCCQYSEIHVTPGDVERIFRATGGNGFYEFAAPINPDYGDQDDDPVWEAHVFREDGTRRVLRRTADGDCLFLSATGCRLDMETRPLVCRLHPFTYTADGIKDELDDRCPKDLLKPGQNLIQILDMSPELGRRWHHQLYEEILLDGIAHRPDI